MASVYLDRRTNLSIICIYIINFIGDGKNFKLYKFLEQNFCCFFGSMSVIFEVKGV